MPTNYEILKDELVTDPVSRGYSAYTAAAAADPLATENETLADLVNEEIYDENLGSLTASEIYNAIDQAEFEALGVIEQQEIWNILHLGDLNPWGKEAARFQAIFGASTTITTLQSIRKRLSVLSRAKIRGIVVKPGYVYKALNLP